MLQETGSLLDSKPHSPVDEQHLNLVQITTGLLWQLIDSKEKADQLLICQVLYNIYIHIIYIYTIMYRLKYNIT